MPNRYIRESAIKSEAVNALSWQGEVFYRRLLNRADDFGRYTANIKLLLADLFPLQLDKVTTLDIVRLLQECKTAGLCFGYQADGKEFLVMNKWEKGRAKHSEYPEPPAEVVKQMKTYVYRCLHMSPTPTPTPIPDSDTDHASDTPTGEKSCDGKRLNGIPNTIDEVITYGKTLNPTVPEDRCRAFWAHYEGQARTGPSGDVFWVTSGAGGGAVVTNWKAKLPVFGGMSSDRHKPVFGAHRAEGIQRERWQIEKEIESVEAQIKSARKNRVTYTDTFNVEHSTSELTPAAKEEISKLNAKREELRKELRQ